MTSREKSTSATGGSAASLADSLDRRSWTPRPWTSFFIRTLIFLAPLLAGYLAVTCAATLVAKPPGLLETLAWLFFIFGISTAAAVVVQSQIRRLAPITALFKMSLVFPDEAPSRFRTALRAGTGRQLARDVSSKKGSEQAAAEELVVLLARLNRHDRLTRGHTERVRAYSVMLGEEIGLSPEELEKLNWAALAHDLGKLDVPAAILNKSGRPTAEEWELLRGHPGASAAYIEPLRPWLGDWVDAATDHHERYDGGGYPRGLAGEDIGLPGRLVAIADAFDVMTAARSYKKPLPAEQARAELLRNAGTQFDPALVRSFLQISLGRMRWTIGPMGWFSHLPDLIRAPIQTAASSGGGLAATGAAAAVAAAAVIVPLGASIANEDESTPVERAVPIELVVDVDDRTFEDQWPLAPVTVVPGDPTDSAPVPTPTTTQPSLDSDTPGAGPEVPTPSTSVAPTTTTTPPSTTTTAAPTLTTALDDTFTITRVHPATTLNVHGNDELGESSADPSTMEVIVEPARGVVAVSGLNLKYTPDDGEMTGPDTVVYRICAFSGSCDTATVSLTLDVS